MESQKKRHLLGPGKNCLIPGAVRELSECLTRAWDWHHQEYSSWSSWVLQEDSSMGWSQRASPGICHLWLTQGQCLQLQWSSYNRAILIASIPPSTRWIGKTNRGSASLICAVANDRNAPLEVCLARENYPSLPVQAKKKKRDEKPLVVQS